MSWCNKSLPTPPRNRNFSYQRFRKLPDCIAACVPTKFTVKMKSPVRLDPADRLILFRRLDRFRKWQSLDDRRFCRCCHKLISGRQIEVIDPTAQDEAMRLVCPTTDCPSNVEDWVYPNEIAQPPDKWGRRVIRVVDSDGERFVVCGKSHGSYRRRLSQRFAFGSRTAA